MLLQVSYWGQKKHLSISKHFFQQYFKLYPILILPLLVPLGKWR